MPDSAHSPACRECRCSVRAVRRGLCWMCWRDPAIRERHMAAPSCESHPHTCLNCGKNRATQARGLCSRCWRQKDVRGRFPLIADTRPERTEPDFSLLRKAPPPVCPCGKRDGECAKCESVQRQKMVIPEVKEDDE